MTTIDKRAAIAALGGPEKAREQIRSWLGRDVYLKEHELALRIALAALEGDDGRALLRQLRDDIARRDATNRRNFEAGISPCKDAAILEGCSIANADIIERIDDLLAAEPAQSAEPAGDGCCPRCGRSNRWHDTDCDDAPADADEARIARWEHLTFSSEERKVQEGVSLMRSLLARAVKAEGVLRAIDEVIADRGVPERDCTLPLPQRVDNLIVELKNWRHSYGEAALLAEKAETEIRHLRAKLAESEAEVERLRGRDAEPFDWDAAPNVQEWIDENLPEREPRAGSKMVELHADEVVADRGEARRVAGWLKDIMAENASLRAEADRMALAVMCGDGGLEVWNRTMTENADLRAKLVEAEAEASGALSLMRVKEAECAMATRRAEFAEAKLAATEKARDGWFDCVTACLREAGVPVDDPDAALAALNGVGTKPSHYIAMLREERDALKQVAELREDCDTIALTEDVRDLLRALGISDHARPVSCHRIVRDEILPAIATLRSEVGDLREEVGGKGFSLLQQERDEAVAERDAALAAQNARAVEELEALRNWWLGKYNGSIGTVVLVDKIGLRLAALRSSPPAAPAGEAPAQGAGDDVLREVLVMPFRELISLDQEQRAIRVLTMGLKELCRRELARVGHHV